MKFKPDMSYAGLILGVLALSASAIFVRIANAPSSVIAFYRLLITGIVLLPFLLFVKSNRDELKTINAKKYGLFALSGLLLAVHYVMWFESLRFTSTSSATVLVALQPLFSILWAFIFLHEKAAKSSLVGCIIAIIGSAVIGWGDLGISMMALFGDVLAVVAAGIISLYFLVGQVVRRDTGVVTYSVFSYFSSSVLLALYILIMGDSFTGYNAVTWGAFLGLALISTIGGQFIFNILLKKLSATAVSMSILGEPIGTCILAYFILSERIVLRQFVGIVIILIGLGIYFFYPIYKAKKS